MRYSGRWHDAPAQVVYASRYYSTALLEKLTTYNGVLPPGRRYVPIRIPHDVTYEVVDHDRLPDWFANDCRTSREFGNHWYAQKRSALLFVPSKVARVDQNVLINLDHPEANRIELDLEREVIWDLRLLESE